ncbi:hypothetical protein Nmel_012772 [Mimus melanotis]
MRLKILSLSNFVSQFVYRMPSVYLVDHTSRGGRYCVPFPLDDRFLALDWQHPDPSQFVTSFERQLSADTWPHPPLLIFLILRINADAWDQWVHISLKSQELALL